MPHARRVLGWFALVGLLAGCGESLPTAPDSGGQPQFASVTRGATVVQRKTDSSLSPLALYPVDPDTTVYDPYKQNLAQTFTAGRSGVLDYVQLPIACAVGVRVKIQIRDGGPVGAVLHDANYDPATTIARGAFILFQVGVTGVPVVAGNTYTIFLASVPSGTTPETTCSIIAGPLGDSYAGGQAYVNNPGFSPYWVDVYHQTPTGTFLMGDLPFVARIS